MRWIVELAQMLKSDNQPEASEVTKAARRIANAPGILVPLCANVLGPVLEKDLEFDFASTVLVGSAAALIETPETSNDLPRMTANGLAAAVHAYRMERGKSGKKVQSLEVLDEQEQRGSLEAWVREHWSTCPTTVSMARSLQKFTDKGQVIVGPDESARAGKRPWGPTVPGAEQEAMAVNVMKSISKGTTDLNIVSETFVIGPGLYQALLGVDQQLKRDDIASIGTPSTSVVQSGNRVLEMPMRSYLQR